MLRATGFDTPYPPARLRRSGCPGWTACWTAWRESLATGDPTSRVPGIPGSSIWGGPGRGHHHRLVVAVGDEVALNQTLCPLETNRPRSRVPSPYAGRIVELGGQGGDTLAVGAVTWCASPGRRQKSVLVGYGTDDRMDTSRRARAKPPCASLPARTPEVDLTAVASSGPDRIVTREDVLACGSHPGHAGTVGSAGRDGQTDDIVP